MKALLIAAVCWPLMCQCCKAQENPRPIEFSKKEQHDQAISLALGHFAVLASWRTGDVSILEDDFLDQGSSDHAGQYREGRRIHRLIFDRDEGKYFHCMQSTYRTGNVTKEGELDTDDWSELAVRFIDSSTETITVHSVRNNVAAVAEPTTRPIDSPEAALDEYRIPTVWAIGIRTLHLPSAQLMKTYDSRILASQAGSYRLHVDGSEAFSLAYPHPTGSATRTTRLARANGFPESDSLTAVGVINGQEVRATGESNDYQWERDASGSWRPSVVVVMKPRDVVKDGKAYRYTQTRIFTFHWHSLNESLSEGLFEQSKVGDLEYVSKLLIEPNSETR